MKKIVILISGNGTNMKSIVNATKEGEIPNTKVELIISSNKLAKGLEFANEKNIKNKVITDEKELIESIKKTNPDLIVLAGYMKILSPEFIKKAGTKIVNIHPALLPKYGGAGMYGIKVHQKVLENREKITGATVHFVEDGVDTGEIITQKSLKIKDDDTAESLQKRVLEKIEHKIYKEAIKKVLYEL